MEPPTEGVRDVLADLGVRDAARAELSELPGGASRETFSVAVPEGRRFVLRRDPEGAESLVPMEGEFRLLALAAEAGVPVAEPLHLEPDGGRFGTAGMLLSFVDGESVGPRVLRREELAPARERLPGQWGEALARIHAIDPGATGLPPAGEDPALEQVGEWARALEGIGEPLPVLELGLRWLRANRPPPAAAALVHGDFRLGNFIVGGEGLAAVIDWELAHLGDPAEDLAWLCIRSWRFGEDEQPVGGVGQIEDLLAAYEAAGGTAPDPERLRYWSVLGNLKWAVICARQAHDHTTGLRRSHELASLGRRICEPEWDMLELIA